MPDEPKNLPPVENNQPSRKISFEAGAAATVIAAVIASWTAFRVSENSRPAPNPVASVVLATPTAPASEVSNTPTTPEPSSTQEPSLPAAQITPNVSASSLPAEPVAQPTKAPSPASDEPKPSTPSTPLEKSSHQREDNREIGDTLLVNQSLNDGGVVTFPATDADRIVTVTVSAAGDPINTAKMSQVIAHFYCNGKKEPTLNALHRPNTGSQNFWTGTHFDYVLPKDKDLQVTANIKAVNATSVDVKVLRIGARLK